VKAARTERDLEQERLEGPLAEELRAARTRAAASQRPNLVSVVGEEPEHPPADPLAAADTRGADPAHLLLVAELVRAQHPDPTDVAPRVEVLWVRSNATHAVWCERRHGATREVICVAHIDGGAVVERWSFG
jgi:hypothetical protein